LFIRFCQGESNACAIGVIWIIMQIIPMAQALLFANSKTAEFDYED
jgi:hypothetical protein